MAKAYEYEINPMQDVFVWLMINGDDLSNNEIKNKIFTVFIDFLSVILTNPNDANYLDFDIIEDEFGYSVLGNNVISALWLSGVIVDDVNLVLGKNKFSINNVLFKYNKKSRKLIKIIENE